MRGRLGLSALLLLCVHSMRAQTESPAVVGVGPFLHIVSDLDQSLAFYHDTLGLALSGPPGDHKFTDNPAVANLYGVPGKQFRAAVLKIAGSDMGIELVQWGEAMKPENKPVADPGAVTLILRRPQGDAKPRILHDPDGFEVRVERSDRAAAELSVSVPDAKEAAALYTRALGLSPDGDWLAIPGSSLRIQFVKASGTSGLKIPFPQPGRGMLRLQVRNIAALTELLKSSGFSVITSGGEPVALPQGPHVIIVRDPNNFYVQPMEMR